MENRDKELIEKHLGENGELKDLWKEHLKLDQQLIKMERKPFLNPQEKIEKKRLQLAKLTGKTRIEEILMEYRSP